MQKTSFSSQRPHERGQTILLVAVSLISLLAMAAFAIDIVTLYAARSELQRATDATALAAAKAIADSGFTTIATTDAQYGNAKNLAMLMATNAINAATLATPPINLVAGRQPLLVGSPSYDFTTHPGSYQVTLSLTVNLPTFFSRIWSRSLITMTTSATAEAYNPANLATLTPISPTSLKPWLVANVDPNGMSTNTPFVNVGTGAVEQGVTGEQLDLIADCRNANPNNCVLRMNHNPPKATPPHEVDYVPLQVSSPANSNNICPACASGTTDYEQGIACADVTSYVTPTCGGGATNAVWDSAFNPRGQGGLSAKGAECLIHAAGPGPWDGDTNLQDTLTFPGWPTNPAQITARSGPQVGNLVTTSSSIVTIPIIDITNALNPPPSAVTVVGFIQGFVNQVNNATAPDPGDINVTVLNIAGCSSSDNGANPVVGGAGTSPIPIRLITP
jgi:Putative Flp pilus-assembly TadE/G-like